MKLSFSKFVGAAVVTYSLAASSFAAADSSSLPATRPIPPDRQGVAPSAAVLFSSSGLGRVGDFSGTIVDLSCESTSSPASVAKCGTGEHHYALRIDGDRALYPLLVLGNQPSLDKLSAGDFTGKEVRISGVHYSSSGTILVNDIHPQR